MKYIFLALILIVLFLPIRAAKTDSLYNSSLKQIGYDKLLTLTKFASELISSYPDSAISVYNVLLTEAQKDKNEHLIIQCKIGLGSAYYIKNELLMAQSCGYEALNLMMGKDEKRLLGDAYSLMGIVKSLMGYPDSSISFLNIALIVYKKISYEQGIIYTLENLANTYSSIGLYNDALEYFLEVENKIDKSDTNAYIIVLNDLANVFSVTENYSKSLEYYTQALELSKKSKSSNISAFILNNLADVNIQTKNYEQSESYLNQAIDFCKKSTNHLLMGEILINYSMTKYMKNDFISSRILNEQADSIFRSIKNEKGIALVERNRGKLLIREGNVHAGQSELSQALLFFKEQKMIDYIMDILSFQSETFRSVGDFKNYSTCLAELNNIKDTISKSDKKYLSSLAILKNNLKIEIENLQNEKQYIALKNDRLKNMIIGIIIIFILSIMFTVFYIKKNKLIKKAKHDLNENNQRFDELQDKILVDLKNALLQLSYFIFTHEEDEDTKLLSKVFDNFSKYIKETIDLLKKRSSFTH
ncbi:MAG: tetratricopeptide repeat protein [Candidatus Kapabacteria bacterium]|nr:tetratricopeptide repeat protein [Candidatus Kapabacteria bacterium]